MAYSYYGGFTQNTGTGNFSLTGQTFPAGFCVIVCYSEKNTLGSLVVTVGATALTQDATAFSSGNYLIGSYSGSITSSTTLTITGTPAFGDCTCGIWTWSGGGTFKSAASVTNNSGAGTLAVTAADYLFALQAANVNFNGSTQTPSNAGPGTPYLIVGADVSVTVADWTVTSTNAAFSVASSLGFGNLLAADYTPTGGVTDSHGRGTNIMRVQPPGWRWHHKPSDFSGWEPRRRVLRSRRSLILQDRSLKIPRKAA